jgi:uncharacterized membrane protein YcaP (DUF421 family)
VDDWFGAPWRDLALVVASTAAFYLTTFVGVRVAGRRTLTQLSAFDALVTIALGSLLATTVVSDEPSYANGAAALVTLLALQVGLGVLRRRVPRLRRVLEFEPEVVLRDGEPTLSNHPFGHQLSEEELWSALRRKGVFDRSSVSVVILEPSGEVSVLPAGHAGGTGLVDR